MTATTADRRPAGYVRHLAREAQRLVQRIKGLGPLGMVALGVIAVAVGLAILGPALAPFEPNAIDLSRPYDGISAAHYLGTDDQGRDLFSQLLYGARSSLLGPLIAIAIALVLGITLAIISAWVGGSIDAAFSGVFNVLFAFPGLLLAILAVAVFGRGLTAPVIALGVIYAPYLGRIVRSAALRERSLPYIAALTIQGVPAWQICVRHILPNIAPIIVANAAVCFGYVIVDLAAVSFLSLGQQPPGVDWGLMLAQGLDGIAAGHPQQAIYAGACVVAVVAAFNILGDRLVDSSRNGRR